LNLSDYQTPTEAGEAILAQALAHAKRAFGPRLVAAYALGSLAHGGFSEHVSDVDFAVVLADPLQPEDGAKIHALAKAIKDAGAPLSDRLSVFWGSPATIAGASQGGRFPPVDLLDLREHGRLMAGRDVRGAVRTPTTGEMVLAAAIQALKMFATDEALAQLRDPTPLVKAGARSLTKRVLFPVRFVYTAQTGRIGRNDAAVEHFVETQKDEAAKLALDAFRWRYEPFAPGDARVVEQCRRGLAPGYRVLVQEYNHNLRTQRE
jgi:hypothetical protein